MNTEQFRRDRRNRIAERIRRDAFLRKDNTFALWFFIVGACMAFAAIPLGIWMGTGF